MSASRGLETKTQHRTRVWMKVRTNKARRKCNKALCQDDHHVRYRADKAYSRWMSELKYYSRWPGG